LIASISFVVAGLVPATPLRRALPSCATSTSTSSR